MQAYVAPYVQVRHAIHLLYATSPYSRDDQEAPLGAEPDGRERDGRRPPTWGSMSDRRNSSERGIDADQADDALAR